MQDCNNSRLGGTAEVAEELLRQLNNPLLPIEELDEILNVLVSIMTLANQMRNEADTFIANHTSNFHH